MCQAVNTISDVAQGKISSSMETAPLNSGGPGFQTSAPYDGPGELAAALDDFDVRTVELVRFFETYCSHV